MDTEYQKFNEYEKAWLDLQYRTKVKVEVVSQSPKRMYSSVRLGEGQPEWDVMTNRLTKI